ncbi:TIGR04282 family arsenosugar biosynthesis glycosyltransferase [Celeribacter sp.]|uniref:TIGR04282 family arsenosugar biosynthesis glycosyltransferase n=1 Tax=Celeribacter sp. TaxID=1890673 RepID=UPI003A90CBD0
MVKEPHAGRVKTRLARDVGVVRATWWYRHNVMRVLQRLESPRWSLVLAVSPDVEGLTSRIWPSHIPRIPQGRGDLGERMRSIFDTLAPAPTCIIGSDIPDVNHSHIRACFATLGSNDAVVGPAPDGGYWLIGLHNARATNRTFMRDVRWSTSHALSDTIASLPDASWAYGPALRDVDTRRDLDAIHGTT